ncbi:hypothetical protein C3B44_03060 [Corynebacterium yudongzhengii]|uniref:Uncharacterized protein n=1 Tax=Corynebacterium yudongzhengii TaxID=2080740 RepID=A0A2U1T7J0_9CORY|nr:hypothetical protein [Corynebacterium yudongzhengii]AWB81457.1 hypothetical protein C3B44_03060 [Corynebacterium yudongzhengii]PWC01971.1 hypothetical protein DF222_05185 [Corynebacterium yudongzhengii]
MHKLAAELRHRELTQEIYNIGDEVAEYIEHLQEAIRDYDGELTTDCLAEFEEIISDARVDARRIIGELIGLRQALTSGVRAGILSAAAPEDLRLPEPELLDGPGLNELHPTEGAPISMTDMAAALNDRTELVTEHLGELVEFVLEQTDKVARDLGAVSLPHLYARTGVLVGAAAQGWLESVAFAHPAFTRSMRGNNPPQFLAERARIDAVVARVAAKKAARNRNFAS